MPKFIPVVLTALLLATTVACTKDNAPAPKSSTSTLQTPPKSAGQPPQKSEASEARPEAPAVAKAGEMTLKVKWTPGKRLVYRMDLDQNITNNFPGMPKPMEQQVHMAMTYSLTPTKQLPTGGVELELEYVANEMEMKMGEQVMMSYDSKEGGKADQNPFVAPFRKMVGSKLHLEINANGLVEKVVDMDAWIEKMSEGLEGPAKGMIGQQFNEGYFRQVADFGHGLPQKSVSVGENWTSEMQVPAGPLGQLKVDQKHTLTGMETHENRKTAAITSSGTMSSVAGGAKGGGPMQNMKMESGQVTARTWFDPEMGVLVETVSDQIMKLTGEIPSGPKSDKAAPKFAVDVGQKVTMKLVEVSDLKK